MNWIPPSVTILLFLAGLLVYRWQKSIDRDAKLVDMRLVAYCEYLKQSHIVLGEFTDGMDPDDTGNKVLNYNAAKQHVLLIGSIGTLVELIKHSDGIAEYIGAGETEGAMEKLRRQQNIMISRMRKDLVNGLSISIRDLVPKSESKSK